MANLTMFRGDDAVLLRQVLVNPQTLQLVTIGPADPYPPGFASQIITGWYIVFTAKYQFPDPDNRAVWQGDTALLGGVTITFPVAGKYQITLPAAATRAFPDGPVVLVYDTKITSTFLPTPETVTIESGTLTVAPSATLTI